MRAPRFTLFAIPIAALSLFAATTAIEVDPRQYLDDVRYLSSESMKGRATGSPELEKAARYIAQQFREDGLEPTAGKSYFQAFTVSTNSHLGPKNEFLYSLGKQVHLLHLDKDFEPFNFSASGDVRAQVVFAGYGITAREYNYDDYAGLDVKDKVVLVLRHEPQEFDAKSVFEGRVYTEHSQLLSKAVNAKMHGARAILFVNDMAAHPGSDDALEHFGKEVSPGSPGIPFIQIKADVAEKWFEAAGKSFKGIQEEIDKDLHPRSFAFPESLEVNALVDVRRDARTVHNVAGYLRGSTDEYIVIGAHYDHLGHGEQFSLAPSLVGTTHPGADDNASGTAGVLGLARWFAHQPRQKRGILFLTFAGEELGLLGSSYFVNHPTFPLEKAVAMINMDMIGRIREGKVYVGGVGTGSNFKQLLDELRPKYPFSLDASDQSGYGSSDHTSFTTKQVPVLFFFSGLHGDYHKPSDTWDKIDAKDAAKLLELIGSLTATLASEGGRPQYVRVIDTHGPHAGGIDRDGKAATSSGGGYGPDFGSIPDFAEVPSGVRFADIRDGSPAAKAGLKAGDILVEFDGKKIENLYDFTYALRAKRPGEEVEVEVIRDNKPLRAKVLLQKRK
jgi:aminopeptidase YwaD